MMTINIASRRSRRAVWELFNSCDHLLDIGFKHLCHPDRRWEVHVMMGSNASGILNRCSPDLMLASDMPKRGNPAKSRVAATPGMLSAWFWNVSVSPESCSRLF